MVDLYWIHEDALRLNHPAALAAGDDVYQFFIWDEAYLQKMDYGFHRLHFIYEALCDMGISIYKGDILTVLKELSTEHQPNALYIAHSANPLLKEYMQHAKTMVTTHIVEDEPFVSLHNNPELKRFFRYWNKAQKVAFMENGGV